MGKVKSFHNTTDTCAAAAADDAYATTGVMTIPPLFSPKTVWEGEGYIYLLMGSNKVIQLIFLCEMVFVCVHVHNLRCTDFTYKYKRAMMALNRSSDILFFYGK